jgi:hypothetical protein
MRLESAALGFRLPLMILGLGNGRLLCPDWINFVLAFRNHILPFMSSNRMTIFPGGLCLDSG